MVIPRSRSSGALSIWSYARYWAIPCLANTLVIAAVKVVLPWSTCPIVPTFTCGLVLSNFSLLMSLSALHFGHDFFRHLLRHLRIVAKLHRVRRPSLSPGSQVGGIAEHLRQRHLRGDHLDPRPRRHPLDLSAPAVEVPDHIAHEFFRGYHFGAHDRFEQHRAAGARGFLERHRASDLEGDLAGVHLVVAAVEGLDFDVHHWVAGDHPVLHRLDDALFHRRDVLLGHHPADDLVVE